MKRFVLCEINEGYMKKVKKQMIEQKLPMPKDDTNITVAHKPVREIIMDSSCDCKVCAIVKEF